MNTWAWIWGTLLFTTLVLYAGLTVGVTIGGFQDIREMFRKLGADRPAPDDDPIHPDE